MKLLLLGLAFAASTLSPAEFRSKPGWQSGSTEARPCVGVQAARCIEAWAWTGTVRWRDCRRCHAYETLRALPPSGIVISVTRVRERPLLAKRRVKWPPRIAARDVTAGMEGRSRRHGYYQLFARVEGRREQVIVWAYFGRGRPTSGQIAAANARLRDARLP